MIVWIASHECSGISEAGGVKNVTFSLCKEFHKAGHKAVLFIPVFQCTNFEGITGLSRNVYETEVPICGKKEKVAYSLGTSVKDGFSVVFVEHPGFAEKEDVYCYTRHEEKLNPAHKKGWGHEDVKFLDNLFAKAVDAFAAFVPETELPDIIHCQDASTANIPLFVFHNPKLKKTQTVVTIHNAGPAYHHEFSSIDEAAWFTDYDIPYFVNCLNDERVEPFLVAAQYGALLTTVSPVYASELTDPAFNNVTDGLAGIFAAKNIQIAGITNGIDIDLYEPSDSVKSILPYEFAPEKMDFEGKFKNRSWFIEELKTCESNSGLLKDIKKYGFLTSKDSEKDVYLCYQGRLASQKGLTVFLECLPGLLEAFKNLKVIVTGQGEGPLEEGFRKLAEVDNYAGRLVFLNGYNKKAARLTVASSDFIVLPSFFEPCGLEDFIASVYGTLPVANRTGGLNKILDGETGFLYSPNTADSLFKKLSEVIEMKSKDPEKILKTAGKGAEYTRNMYSWDKVTLKEYIPLFESLIKK